MSGWEEAVRLVLTMAGVYVCGWVIVSAALAVNEWWRGDDE